MSGHTPGPWSAPSAGIYAADGTKVAVCTSKQVAESVANAALIAAAPDLLAALKRMCIAFGPLYGAEGPSVKERTEELAAFKQARAAVAKAEGRATR